MYYGCKREDQDAATREYIKAYRDAADLYPKIKEVIISFDHKVFNKRFQSALQDGTGARVYVENRPNMIDIYVYGPRSIVVSLATLHKDDMQDGKRINAEKFVESLTDRRAALLKKAALYDQQMLQIDQVKEQLKQLDKQMDAVLAPFDYTIRDIYRLSKRIY